MQAADPTTSARFNSRRDCGVKELQPVRERSRTVERGGRTARPTENAKDSMYKECRRAQSGRIQHSVSSNFAFTGFGG